jgi:hypothetical protein|tara:strand:- start:417 stop:686 length:270 start_codon:yes stop_codon:yes gene_type:complete
MASLADILSESAILFFGNWELLALVAVLIGFAVFLAQSRAGAPATLVIILFLSYALSLLGQPWVGFFYTVIFVTAVVIARAILQIGQQQ